MKVQVPEGVSKILKKVSNKDHEIYIVGGAVRDVLMGKSVYDWDFTTDATPEQIQSIFSDSFYDNKYGTVGIPNGVEGERPYEITTFRTEHGYSDARRPDKVKWGKTIFDDLKRRDFTINAMALTHKNFEIIDPYDGQKDLKKKLIRAVGDPNDRFSEDALRMMRAVRIASELGFTVEENTFEAIKSNVALINKIAKERIKDELFKILASPHPYEGILIFKNVGLMMEILPEMEKTFGVEQKSPGRHHIYDVGTHSLYSLKHVAERNPSPVVRLATLIHDIGKPQTFKKLDSGTITFYNHEIVSAQIAKRIADRLRFANSEKEKLWKLVRCHQFSVDERQTDSALRRFIKKVGLENIQDMLDLRVGDRLGGGARETSWRLEEFKKRIIEVQKEPFSVRDLKVDGNDVMKVLNLTPSPKVGEVLQKLFEEVVEKKIDNEKDILLQKLKELS
jgi:poly(A) polymerase/tRNA nucleotidyltransferase (CCA-adding enzyme)